MTRAWWPLVVVVVAVASGCAAYHGGGRPIDPARVTTEPGWIAAAPTPEVRQRGALDCGAATLAMVAGRWHRPWPREAIVRALPEPTADGVSLGELRDAARDHRLTAFAIAGDRATLEHELAAGRPIIVGLLVPLGDGKAQPHYEVVVATRPRSDELVTIDPGTGWRTRSWDEFDAAWQPAGRPALIVLGPMPPIRVADQR